MGHTGQATVRSMEPDLTADAWRSITRHFTGATLTILSIALRTRATGTLTVDVRVFYATESGSHAHITNSLDGQRWRGACSPRFPPRPRGKPGKTAKVDDGDLDRTCALRAATCCEGEPDNDELYRRRGRMRALTLLLALMAAPMLAALPAHAIPVPLSTTL